MKGNYERKAGSKVSDFNTETLKEAILVPETPVEEKSVAKTEPKIKSVKKDNLDTILAPFESLKKTGKSRGVQKSCYFEADIYEWLNEKAEKAGVPFSTVLNLALKQAMK